MNSKIQSESTVITGRSTISKRAARKYADDLVRFIDRSNARDGGEPVSEDSFAHGIDAAPRSQHIDNLI
jgi:hypothetical protein